MRYCTYCGEHVFDEAVVCVYCGRAIVREKPSVTPAAQTDNDMSTVIKVFLVLGCIAQGWLLIPLAWCIPITVQVFKKLNRGYPISTGLKVCALLFVNFIAGVCLLCIDDF